MIKIKNILSISLFSLAFVACEKVEDYENVRTGKSNVSLVSTTGSAVEGTPITFTLKVDVPLAVAMDYKIELSDAGSTANFRDFTTSGVETSVSESGFGQGKIGYIISVPAQATTFSFTVTPVVDLFVEGKEVLNLRLSSAVNGRGLVAPGSEILSVNITDFVSNDIGMKLEWANITTSHGTIQSDTYFGLDEKTHDVSGYDFDFNVNDGSGSDVTAAVGQTGASPEVLTFDSVANTDPAPYTINVQTYNVAAAIRPKVPFTRTIKLDLSKYGVWGTTIDIPFKSNGVFTGAAGLNVAKILKTGNTYTVTNLITGVVLIVNK